MLLSVLVGSGMQLVAMTGLVLGKYEEEEKSVMDPEFNASLI